MFTNTAPRGVVRLWFVAVFVLSLFGPTLFGVRVRAQSLGNQPIHFRVEGKTQRLEMIVNTSRILTVDHNVPRLLVNNTEIVKATPLSPNKIQVSAMTPGVTQLNVWDDKGGVHSIDVVIYGDARELEELLKDQFPDASLRIRPLANSVVISGYVPQPDMVGRIIRIAEDYYPNVINNMTVGGVQQVNLHVKVMEVSRTKLRRLGVDWANINGDDFVIQSVSGLLAPGATQGGALTGLGGDTVRFGILTQPNVFGAFIEAMRQYNLVKVLAEPTLTTVSGRPAMFNVGGEFPIIVPQSLGTVSVEYREFGTRIDFVPIVLGNGNIRLEVRPQVSEIDPSRSVVINNLNVPGLRTRWVDTGVEMKAGQTLALAGLIQNRVESENRGIPVLADLPWVGTMFRRVEEQNNEIELLIMVTPELVEAMDCHEVPKCGPGLQTTIPGGIDFYMRGYMEVPKCCPDKCGPLGCCDQFGVPAGGVGAEGLIVPSERVPHGAPGGQGAPSADQVAPPNSGSALNGMGPPSNPQAYRYPSRVRSVQPVSAQRPTRRGQPPSQAGANRQNVNRPGLIGSIGYESIR